MRATTAIATTLVTTATLLLTACGGGGSDSSDKITAPATTTATGVTPAPTATATPAGGTLLKTDPGLVLPKDVRMVFDWTMPADRTKSAVLTATANYLRAMAYSVTEQSTKGTHLGNYATDQAYSYATDYVQRNVKAKLTVTGEDRYYQPVVTLLAGKRSAEVTLCEDQAKLYSREVVSGKTLITAASANSYLSYRIIFSDFREGAGLWRAAAITVKGRATQCEQ